MDGQDILAATALMPSVIAVLNFATLYRTAATRFLPQEYFTTKIDLIQGIDIPTPKGTDHTLPITVRDMEDISAGHSPTAIPTTTEAAASEGKPHAPHPDTMAAHAALPQLEAPITTHAVTPTGMLHPIPHSPLLLQMSLTPLHRQELVSLQQLPPHCTGNTAKKSQATSKTFHLP